MSRNHIPRMERGKESNSIESAVKEMYEINISSRADFEIRLANIIKDIDPGDQYILSLYYCDNLTVKEIGGIFRVKEQEVLGIMDATAEKLKVEMMNGCSMDN
jgi:DNA-directed RNA polymerase specialized sigma subunit